MNKISFLCQWSTHVCGKGQHFFHMVNNDRSLKIHAMMYEATNNSRNLFGAQIFL